MSQQLPVLYELRVLRGEQRGAAAPVPLGEAVEVSADWGSDIVLQAAELGGCRVRLQLQGAEALLDVLDGTVVVGGEQVGAGQAVVLPLYQPVALGDTVVALGAVGAPQWAALFEPEAAAASPDAAPGVPNDTAASPATAPALRAPRWVHRLVTAGAALVVASAGMYAIASAVGPQPVTVQQQAHRAQALLHAQGLTGLSVKADGHTLVVSGYLETNAQRSRVERALADEGLAARLDLWVNEQVAAAVREVYRVNGVTAEVQAVGPGAVRVHTQVAAADHLQAIEAKARRDVPGLNALQAMNQPPARTPTPVPVVDDPGKRVAAVVPGEAPHVVTADGTRYFVGALLPTGHRIRSIHDSAVELEREGSVSALQF